MIQVSLRVAGEPRRDLKNPPDSLETTVQNDNRSLRVDVANALAGKFSTASLALQPGCRDTYECKFNLY